MRRGDLAVLTRSQPGSPNRRVLHRSIVIILDVEGPTIHPDHEPLALVLQSDGSTTWEWIGNLHAPRTA